MDNTATDVITNEKEDTSIIHYVNQLISDAIQVGASDIHFEPYEKLYRIRYRQDGILYEIAKPPVNLASRIAARLKIMSRLDISERRIPQDGRFKLKNQANQDAFLEASEKPSIDFRVSTCPTLFGEKIVIRILDPNLTPLNVDTLGFENFQKELFLKAIHKPQGMILITGPTGSGKTVTLYTALNILNTAECNISTCEDPVEINLPGINQVPMNVKTGLTFGTALRAFLRQDPDVIMIGEIRDLETAEIAIKAAETGHRVISTLHTNNSSDTLTRLVNIGVPTYHLATSISLIIAQRLARRLCPQCKVVVQTPPHVLKKIGFKIEEIADLILFSPKGCAECKEGYKGRVGIYEVLPITSTIAHMIMSGKHAFEIQKQAQNDGMWTLRGSGFHKLKQGIISLEEFNRITWDQGL